MVTRTVPIEDANPKQQNANPLENIPPPPVDVLILGAGWTSTFLIPLLNHNSLTHAATSTTGRSNTISFKYDPLDPHLSHAFTALPSAKTVLITFPLRGTGPAQKLVDLYEHTRHSPSPCPSPSSEQTGSSSSRLYIQLGSTGIFTDPHWNTCASSYDKSNARAQAEDDLLAQNSTTYGADRPEVTVRSTVLNLSGLYGGSRQPRTWLPRVIKRKSDVAGKKALHLVHGADVAEAVLGCHLRPKAVAGRRWILTDLHVYDWWDLIVQWASEEGPKIGLGKMEGTVMKGGLRDFGVEVEGVSEKGPSEQGVEEGRRERIDLQEIVFKNLEESGIRALPRDPDALGRVLDGRDFWRAVGRHPTVGRVQ